MMKIVDGGSGVGVETKNTNPGFPGLGEQVGGWFVVNAYEDLENDVFRRTMVMPVHGLGMMFQVSTDIADSEPRLVAGTCLVRYVRDVPSVVTSLHGVPAQTRVECFSCELTASEVLKARYAEAMVGGDPEAFQPGSVLTMKASPHPAGLDKGRAQAQA
jgi:hypothetical protein